MRVIAALKFGFISIVWFILAFMVLMMINDGPAEYGDVSHAPEYAGWVGQRCTVLKGLVAHGVTFHPGPNEVTDVVHISPRRIGGPEITFERPIHRGTDMLITGVERCVVVPSPTWLLELPPQQSACPPVRRAQVWKSPPVICAASARFITVTGVGRSTMVSSPS